MFKKPQAGMVCGFLVIAITKKMWGYAFNLCENYISIVI